MVEAMKVHLGIAVVLLCLYSLTHGYPRGRANVKERIIKSRKGLHMMHDGYGMYAGDQSGVSGQGSLHKDRGGIMKRRLQMNQGEIWDHGGLHKDRGGIIKRRLYMNQGEVSNQGDFYKDKGLHMVYGGDGRGEDIHGIRAGDFRRRLYMDQEGLLDQGGVPIYQDLHPIIVDSTIPPRPY